MDCPERRCDTEAAAVGLPDDPLVEILSRVPVKSLCRFKCVSKAWGRLIADPLHRKKLPQTLQGFFFTGVDDGEHGTGTDDGSHDKEPQPPRQLYGFFDVLQKRVRTEDFSYLSELLPGPAPAVLEETRLLHSCNGLLLFAVHYSGCCISESYVVCNPATKQCVAVPSSGFTREQMRFSRSFTYLLFNPVPGVCCDFCLVQVSVGRVKTSVHVYSSKTQAWSHNKSHWGCHHFYSPGVYVNGMLHLLVFLGKDRINVVDVEGNIQKVIPAPCLVGRDIWPKTGFIGQSQGCLYYCCYELEIICDDFSKQISARLLIWVLQDYDRQHWVLKDDVSFLKLFGERNNPMDTNYNVVGIHPDHSLVFLVQHWDQKLISYNIDTKEVCYLCTLGQHCKGITPYVPYFSALGA